MLSADLLRRLRNDLPMPVTIAALGRAGPPAKMSEGYFRFLCPHGGEMRATVNPRNNLAHCFGCKKNLNNIDLLLTLDYDFRAAVTLLERWLKQYQAQATKRKTPPPPTQT
jgi:DNA primase